VFEDDVCHGPWMLRRLETIASAGADGAIDVSDRL
jgi:hypothetical protein